jgi:hypothetical protein
LTVPTTDEHRTNFESWYVSPLQSLYTNPDAGFVIIITVFALLERYLRQKNGLSPKDNLTDQAWVSLCDLFPTLASKELAHDFWDATRNGLLHQITFQTSRPRNGETPPGISFSHEYTSDLRFSEGRFELHPQKFCETVLNAITINFGVYCGVNANTKLPSVSARVRQYQEGKLDRKAVPPGQIALTTSVE